MPAYVWVLAAVSAGLVFLRTLGLGIGIATDSIAYLAGAKSLLAGVGYTTFDGMPNTQWPPLYSATLALLSLTGLSPEQAARYVNALSFAGIVILGARWLGRHVGSRLLALLGTLAIFMSIPLTGVMTFAWSEGLFSLLVLLFITQGERVLTTGSTASVVLLALCAAAGTLTRYVGVTLVFAGLGVVLAQHRQLQRRVRDAVVFLGVSGIPVAAWFLRNYLVAGQFRGGWQPSPYTLPQLVALLLDTIALWFFPTWVPRAARLAACFALMIGLTVILVMAWRRGARDRSADYVSVVQLASFLIAYAAFMTGITLSKKLDFDWRMFAPTVAPLLLLITFAADRLPALVERRAPRRWVTSLAAVAFATSLVYPAWHLLHSVSYAMRIGGGGGFNTRRWRDSDLIDYLRRQPIDASTYTNAPGAVYIHTGLVLGGTPARDLPDLPSEKMQKLLEFSRAVPPDSQVHIVMFTAPDLPEWYYRYTPSELATVFDADLVATTSDGAIYRVRRHASGMVQRSSMTPAARFGRSNTHTFN